MRWRNEEKIEVHQPICEPAKGWISRIGAFERLGLTSERLYDSCAIYRSAFRAWDTFRIHFCYDYGRTNWGLAWRVNRTLVRTLDAGSFSFPSSCLCPLSNVFSLPKPLLDVSPQGGYRSFGTYDDFVCTSTGPVWILRVCSPSAAHHGAHSTV